MQRIVRRGKGSSPGSHVRWRRAVVVHASAGGNSVPVIARLVSCSQDRVREMIRRFNESGMASLDPQWAGGRPRRITDDDTAFVVETARQRPEKLGLPFTRWSLRKLSAYLAGHPARPVRVGRQRLSEILDEAGVTFQRTRTWKDTDDPDREAKLDRIEDALENHPDRTFAFDEFGPLPIRPTAGAGWPEFDGCFVFVLVRGGAAGWCFHYIWVGLIRTGFCAGSKDWSEHGIYGHRSGAGGDVSPVFG